MNINHTYTTAIIILLIHTRKKNDMWLWSDTQGGAFFFSWKISNHEFENAYRQKIWERKNETFGRFCLFLVFSLLLGASKFENFAVFDSYFLIISKVYRRYYYIRSSTMFQNFDINSICYRMALYMPKTAKFSNFQVENIQF